MDSVLEPSCTTCIICVCVYTCVCVIPVCVTGGQSRALVSRSENKIGGRGWGQAVNLISINFKQSCTEQPFLQKEKGKKYKRKSLLPHFHSSYTFTPQLEMKTHYAAMYFGILHRAFIVLKSAVTARQALPL